jgi:ketopantoate reductase
MSSNCSILILGASYGSLLATKLLLAGHDVTLVCLPEEAELINRDGTRVRMPVRGHDGLVEIDSRNAPGKLAAAGPGDVDPSAFDLVALAMQEPQYRAPAVRTLLDAVAKSRVPCMSIMNMPPHAYLKRLPGLDADSLRDCYTDASVWDGFDPATITLASPDPQAFRPPEEPLNVLQVSLPTNFKVARFESDKDTALLRRLEDDIQAVRFEVDGTAVELPVKLKVHDSVFVPLAKWCMLLTGNYRCVGKDAARSIKEAVHTDLEQSRAVYEWVADLCRRMGAQAQDQVPFEKYANAALGLTKPSSAARALFAGAPNIERVDRVVQSVAKQHGLRNPVIDEIVALVDARLALNRKAAA